MILFRQIRAGALFGAVLGMIALAATTAAQGPATTKLKNQSNNTPTLVKEKEPIKEKEPEVKPPQKFKWSERKIPSSDISGKTWAAVFQWLGDQTGLPFSGATHQPPGGTLTFITPKTPDGKAVEYTLVEFWDIINEILQGEKKFTMLRRESVFQLYPADEMPPDHLVPFVLMEDLPDRGRTDIVKVLVTYKRGNVSELAVTVKRILGDFGTVTPLEETNQLLMKSTVSAIRTAIKVTDPGAIEQGALDYAYKCNYIRAAVAEQVLTKALGQSRQIVTRVSDGKGPPGGGGPPGFQPKSSSTVRETTVTHEKSTNKVFVHGPADRIEQAKAILKELDTPPSAKAKKLLEGGPRHEYHDLLGGSAESMVKFLTDIYKTDDSIRIHVAGPSRLFIWADAQTQHEIGQIVIGSAPSALETKAFVLRRLDAKTFVEELKVIVPGAKDNSPHISADLDQNAIRVRGSKQQVEEVQFIIKVYDGPADGQSSNVRTIILEKASGATVAEGLTLLLRQLRGYDVELEVPEGLDEIKNLKLPDKKTLPKDLKDVKPDPKKIIRITPDDVRDLMNARDAKSIPVAFKSQEEKKEEEKKKIRIFIHGFGNRIILKSDDKEALDLAQQMVRVLVNTEAGPGDIKVLKLRVADAVEVAKILDEAFNGPKGQQQQGGGRGGGGPGGLPGMMLSMVVPGLGSGTGGRIEAIRVVADSSTNSLLVRARPIDMLTIRRLLDNELDVLNLDSDAVVRGHEPIKLEHASAIEVADIVRQLYAEQMKSGPTRTQGGGGNPFSPFGQRPPTDSSGTARASLSVSSDPRTNSLHIVSSNTLYKEIKRLADTIEDSSSKSGKTVGVILAKDLKGVNPYDIQQALATISGRQTTSGRQGSGTDSGLGTTTGSFAPGGFGTGMRGAGFGGGFPGGGFGGGFQGGAFPGGGFQGGALTPGGGGGFRQPGGGGGGFRQPGGGGGGTKGGGGPKGRSSLERGPDFFAQRVMDDPKGNVNVLYDPSEEQEDPNSLLFRQEYLKNPSYTANPFHLAALMQDKEIGSEKEKDKEKDPKLPEPKEKSGTLPFEQFKAPLLPFQVEVLPSGDIVITAFSKSDLDAILKIIEFKSRNPDQASKIDIQLVPVRFGDPVSIANELSKLFGTVSLNPNDTTLRAVTGTRPTQTPTPTPIQIPGVPTLPQAPQATAGTVGQPTNMILLPQPRLGAILVAAYASRMPDIVKEIQRLDQPISDVNRLVEFPLKRASATRVAASLNQFYAIKYPLDVNLIRITWDDRTNSVFVQASPADLTEIRRFIDYIDNSASAHKAEIRVVPLKNAVAQELATLLQLSIANGALTINAQPGGVGLGGGGLPAGIGAGGIAQPTLISKNSSLVFKASRADGNKPQQLEAQILEDIRINPDIRTNTLVISAPQESMQLVLALVAELDVAPLAKSEIRVFQLKKTDAIQFATMLQQLFLGTGQVGAAGGAPAAPAIPAAAGARPPISILISDSTSPGAPIIDLRITVDERTNSLIVAGAYTDILVVESIYDRIENAKVPERRSEAIRLRNSQATDVAGAINTFVTALTTKYSTFNQATNFLSLQRDVVVTPEAISNSLLINATPEHFDKIVQLIAKIDTPPPQVVISVLIAEVTMAGNEEFGMEIGLQTPLLFQRGTAVGTASATYATFTPGYDFANASIPLGNNVLANPSAVGFQGLSNTGVGRFSPTSNVGGFVFSAGSDTVNVLIRALKVQNRLNILSRPQIMTLDNQSAYLSVGQFVPYVSGFGAVNTLTGAPTPLISNRDTGVTMLVTPRITPDGRVLMRVIPDISSISPSTVNLGNGVLGTIFNQQRLETTVLAADGETIIMGGLITKRDEKQENKIPWLGDLPGIGAAFRYRTYKYAKTELVIIMTPHIIRNQAERERILVEETRKIDWKVPDVIRIHGQENCVPFTPSVLPEPHTKREPYQTFPGTPAGTETAPQKVVPLEYVPEPAPSKGPVIGKGGVLRSLFGKRSPEPVEVEVAPSMTTTVKYLPAVPTTPPLPELLPAGRPQTLPFSVPTSPGLPVPPNPDPGPSLRP